MPTLSRNKVEPVFAGVFYLLLITLSQPRHLAPIDDLSSVGPFDPA